MAWKMRLIQGLLLLMVSLPFAFFTDCQNIEKGQGKYVTLAVEDYKNAVYASWVGQLIGNTYGLSYEFSFIDEPGPDSFPYGYGSTLAELEKYNGAYSDDDTDIEYMYLSVMEESGIEPTYGQLAAAWKRHVKERVWFANRMALTLMHAGHYPPVTGMKGFNSEWFQIDPQLVNEIWSVTAPGMIDYAVAKSEFSARITSDDFGLEPTKHYAAMYSAAFFEKDIEKLIDIGLRVIPENGRFYQAVKDVKEACQTYPSEWQKARKTIKDKYYRIQDYNRHSWAAVDAILNGAFGIMALIYGEGDFQKTLDYCCALGMDADNQAATMCGLLGIVNGMEGIPRHLMFPIEGAGWEKPFNDSYKMITREGLTDATIKELADRTSRQGERIILANGGAVVSEEGRMVYRINIASQFKPPFELNPIPELVTEVNTPLSYPVYSGTPAGNAALTTKGTLPPGITLKNQMIEGIAVSAGTFEFELIASWAGEVRRVPVSIIVHSKNLATEAVDVLYNEQAIDHSIELIRDGQNDKTYYSIKNDGRRETDYYGYLWDDPVMISGLIYNTGAPHEFSGWFTSFDVEFLHDGHWEKIEAVNLHPQMNLDNSQWLKPAFMEYHISFPPVQSRGIRIMGLPGGIEKDAANAHLGKQYYTAISELKAFSD